MAGQCRRRRRQPKPSQSSHRCNGRGEKSISWGAFTYDIRKILDFWNPSPLSLANSRNLSVLLFAFDPTPSTLSADVICEWAYCPSDCGPLQDQDVGREGTKGSIIGAFFFLPPWISDPDLPKSSPAPEPFRSRKTSSPRPLFC